MQWVVCLKKNGKNIHRNFMFDSWTQHFNKWKCGWGKEAFHCIPTYRICFMIPKKRYCNDFHD